MSSLPVVPDFTDGIFTAAKAQQLSDAIAFYFNPPRARLRRTTTQSITNSVATAVSFDSEDVDTDPSGGSGHDSGVNPSRYTANYPGRYLLAGGVVYAASATARRGLWWRVNGSDVNGSQAMIQSTSANQTGVVARTITVYLNVNDYVELMCWQESGGALNLSATTHEMPTMSVLWVASS